MSSPEKLQEAIATILSLATENSWAIITPTKEAYSGKGLVELISRGYKLEDQKKLMSHLLPAPYQVHPGDSKPAGEQRAVDNFSKELQKEAIADAVKVKEAQKVKELKQNLPLYAEQVALIAQATRIKFNAYLREGFTPEQAVEFCKTA